MKRSNLPVDPPEGCQWRVKYWYFGVSGLYLIESTRKLRDSSANDLFYFVTPMPPSMLTPRGEPTHSIGDTCVVAFGHARINHPDDTRTASKRLVRRFTKFARQRARDAAAAAYRARREAERAASLSSGDTTP